MAKKTSVIMTKGRGQKKEKLEFVSIKQAAGYFHGKEKVAASMASATVNIYAAIAGEQVTGQKPEGTPRYTAYGYKVVRK